MLLKYVGEREMDLIPNHIYKSKKIYDDLGDGYSIFDEGEDWYRYGADFVAENFVEVEEIEENLRQAV